MPGHPFINRPEDGVALAHTNGGQRQRVPDNVSEAAYRRKGLADLIPVVTTGQFLGRAHTSEPGGGGCARAAVLDVKGDADTGSYRSRERDNHFGKAAGVVDVRGVIVADPLHWLIVKGNAIPTNAGPTL